MSLILKSIGLAALAAPLIWELNDDKNGDDGFIVLWNKAVKVKTLDVYVRGIITFLVAQINYLLGENFFAAFALCSAIHFLIFDYAIAYTLGFRNWWSYLGSKSWVDNLLFWRNLHWEGRLFIRLLVFFLTLFLYSL